MRAFFRKLKVRQKLFVLLAIAILGMIFLSLSSSLWLVSQNALQKHDAILTTSLYTATNEKRNSQQWLEKLNQEQSFYSILAVAHYDQNGKQTNATHHHFPTELNAAAIQAISENSKILSGPDFTLVVELQTNVIRAHLKEIIIISFLLALSGALLTYFILYIVDRLITRPIMSLNFTTNEIAIEHNYSLRAKHFYPDEIGTLSENFNYMLNRIELHDQMLRTEKDRAEQASKRAIELSQKMHDKNAEIKKSYSQINETNEKLGFEVKVRARIERKLNDLQKYLNNIINSMPSAIIAIDDSQNISQWNKGASELTGFTRDQAIGNPLTLACPFLEPFSEMILESLSNQRLNKIERIPLNTESTSLLLDITIFPLLDTTPAGAVLRIDDMTQKAQMEDMMVQSEKMMSLGGLAAGMAHEINNPLGAIIHTVQNIQRRLDTSNKKNIYTAEALETDIDTVRRYVIERDIFTFLDNITEAGTRASTIVSNMLQFSRQTTKNLQPQNLHQIIDRAINIAKNEYSLSAGYDLKTIEIIREFENSLPEVPCIPSEIEQVILNLLKNAAQALKDYQTQKTHDPEWHSQITITTRLNSSFAEVTVQDNGPGMDEQTRKQIFEPFFTTKEVGAGTGLGLSVSYFILTSHHQGNMHVVSNPGHGTCFTLQLPMQGGNQIATRPKA